MITILPESTESRLGFSISGKVAAEDYDVLVPKMDEAISVHGKINLLVVIENFEAFVRYAISFYILLIVSE